MWEGGVKNYAQYEYNRQSLISLKIWGQVKPMKILYFQGVLKLGLELYNAGFTLALHYGKYNTKFQN